MFDTTRKFRKALAGLVAIAAVGVLALPAMATGQTTVDADCGTPTIDQYGNQVDTLTCIERGSGGDPGLGGNVGPLPFTGFDVIAMLAVALAVTGLGLALQRAVSRPSAD